MGATQVDVGHITRIAGEGGHISYHVEIKTREGAARQCRFSGNMFVGPVVLTSTTDDGATCSVVIDEPRRFGEFASEQWVRRIFDDWPDDLCTTADPRSDDFGTYRQTG